MKKRILNCAIAMAVTASTGMLSFSQAYASSHREAPNITRMPKVDSTDFYMFNSYESGRDGFVTLIANYIPLQDPQGGPNYFSMDPSALYEIHIDNNGDAVEDLTFQFRFRNTLINRGNGISLQIGPDGSQNTVAIPLKQAGGIGVSAGNANLGFRESYSMTMVQGDRRRGQKSAITHASTGERTFTKPFDYVGEKTFGDSAAYEAYARQYVNPVNIPGCGQGNVFVGQRKESFAVNLGETFDLVNYAPIEGSIAQDTANDDLRNKNITTIALEVPASCLTSNGSSIIGGWTSASLHQVRILNRRATFNKPEINGGAWTQVSRLGSPLVNELVIGLKDKDRFSVTEPSDDGQFATYVTHPTLPALLDLLFREAVNSPVDIAPTNFPRNDLVAAFLTGFAGVNQPDGVVPSEMLRLNTAIPAVDASLQNNFGVAGDDLAGFPNGRRPGDDVVDVALRVVMGRLCHPVPVNGVDTDLGLCTPQQATVGTVPFTDGAPISAADFDSVFPYLRTPIAGSPNN